VSGAESNPHLPTVGSKTLDEARSRTASSAVKFSSFSFLFKIFSALS
jgi:hypothetical protein